MSDELIFEEPPHSHARIGATAAGVRAWLDKLRAHPGKWAKYPEPVNHAYPSQLNRGVDIFHRYQGFEAVGRRDPGMERRDRTYLYARYIGEGADR